MRSPVLTTALYADHYLNNAKQTVIHTKDKVIENQAELARLGATAVVVGVAARVCGFKAGYKFALATAANAVQ